MAVVRGSRQALLKRAKASPRYSTSARTTGNHRGSASGASRGTIPASAWPVGREDMNR